MLQSLVSTSYLYVAEMFVTSTRGATTGFAYNTASAIWGGLAPFYATMLKNQIQYFPAWCVPSLHKPVSLISVLLHVVTRTQQ